MDPIILVHGGAGDIPDSRVAGKLRGSKMAAARAHRLLRLFTIKCFKRRSRKKGGRNLAN
ncbi:hypothetical protein JYU34_018178 [Plutella xylostella]|uniref:Uncharacterized protein n=1 Tax=Plutella xylostella TaxID=51655 RepID=A0ABQ7Q3Q4_PLUXY|nr:hypothetical protein JYU34_018178 [Plutella xylostella]